MRGKFTKFLVHNQLLPRNMNYLCIKRPGMKILITNDDGIHAKGLRTLVKILRPYGEITVVAPKKMQSGMSMAVNLGQGPIATRKVKDEDGVAWWYLDGTPSSCVKLGIDNIFYPEKPDVVVSGINHGGNYGTAYLYSGTIGAAAEAALAYIPAIAVSQDAFDKIDCVTPMDRQEFMLKEVLNICDKEFKFDNFEDCRNFYKELINAFKQMNYSEYKSEQFNKYLEQVKNLSAHGNI